MAGGQFLTVAVRVSAKPKLMKTFIRKNTWSTAFLPAGWGNGYVLIPEGHPLHGKHYNDIDVDVHGGLTYSELVDEDTVSNWGLPPDSLWAWCVGFDTCHYGDNVSKWPKEAVQAEADRLMEQLKGF